MLGECGDPLIPRLEFSLDISGKKSQCCFLVMQLGGMKTQASMLGWHLSGEDVLVI